MKSNTAIKTHAVVEAMEPDAQVLRLEQYLVTSW